MSIKISPLQEITNHPWGDFRLLLKREDLLIPAGGNKVRRFDAFFEKRGHLKAVMTLSNPGSHSFHVLTRYLKPGTEEAGCDHLYFLERNIRMSPYHKSRRQDYLFHTGVTVIPGDIISLLSRQSDLRRQGVAQIGIGGQVSIHPNPYLAVMEQCVGQLREAGIDTAVEHILPVASGNMADGFLKYIQDNRLKGQTLLAIMTGALPSRWMLRIKYFREEYLKLKLPVKIDYAAYKVLAHQFHEVTGVWLDPGHTIQFMPFLKKNSSLKGKTLVLWMTHPFLEKLIF